MVVIAKRAVAIQLDYFVVPQSGQNSKAHQKDILVAAAIKLMGAAMSKIPWFKSAFLPFRVMAAVGGFNLLVTTQSSSRSPSNAGAMPAGNIAASSA